MPSAAGMGLGQRGAGNTMQVSPRGPGHLPAGHHTAAVPAGCPWARGWDQEQSGDCNLTRDAGVSTGLLTATLDALPALIYFKGKNLNGGDGFLFQDTEASCNLQPHLAAFTGATSPGATMPVAPVGSLFLTSQLANHLLGLRVAHPWVFKWLSMLLTYI